MFDTLFAIFGLWRVNCRVGLGLIDGRSVGRLIRFGWWRRDGGREEIFVRTVMFAKLLLEVRVEDGRNDEVINVIGIPCGGKTVFTIFLDDLREIWTQAHDK